MARDQRSRAVRRARVARHGRPPRGLAPALLGMALCVLVLPPALSAAGKASREQEDPFQGALFGAELVIKHQEAIGLTSQQRDEVVLAMQRMRSAVVPSQLSLSASAERLLVLLRRPRVDVEGALAEAQEAMRLENQVKLEQVRFLIEVKNLLTADQQSQLDRIRTSS